MIKFSVVVPIHNEEKNLPYSLPSIYRLNPDEVILLMDHCTDNSEHVAYGLVKQYGMLDRTRFVGVDSRESDFRFCHAFNRYYGGQLASYDVVLNVDADLIVDHKIASYVERVGKNGVGFISFLHKNYPVDWRLLVKRLLVAMNFPCVGREKWLGVIRLYNRRIANELEDLDELKQLMMAQDAHLRRAIAKKYKTVCVVSNTLHLRPSESSRHYLRGRLYWIDLHRSFLVTLLSSVIVLRLNLLKGYIHARFGKQQ